jgi:hypothetical protein
VTTKLQDAISGFYRVVVTPAKGGIANVFGSFLALENDREVSLLPIVYQGDLVIRGKTKAMPPAGAGELRSAEATPRTRANREVPIQERQDRQDE